VHALLIWIEGSALGHAMRESGVWTYGLVNLAHILGVSSLFGSVLILDARMMGAWRAVPLDLLARPTVRIASGGLALALLSGVCLLSANATEYAGNPFLPIKFGAIAVALANVWLVGRSPAWRDRGTRTPTAREEARLAVSGAVSLVSWIVAIGAGRLIGYW
jgi:hypothetical protein